MALDVTVGGNDSESYATLEELRSYLIANYGEDNTSVSAFVDLDDSVLEQRLRVSALVMNSFPYRGVKASRDQRLAFPRWWRTDDEYDYVMDDEDYFINYSEITSNAPTIPTEVKYAQCEIAYQVVEYMMNLDVLAFPEKEIKSFGLGGSLAIEFFGDTSSTSMSKASISSLDIIYAYLNKWYKRITGGAV